MNKFLAALSVCLFTGCTTHVDTSTTTDRISCTTTADCAASAGGECIDAHCRADNECTTAADCTSPEACVASSVFGGLCAQPGTAPTALPGPTAVPPAPVTCTTDAQCPIGERCNPSCTNAVGGTCEPDGLPTQPCP